MVIEDFKQYDTIRAFEWFGQGQERRGFYLGYDTVGINLIVNIKNTNSLFHKCKGGGLSLCKVVLIEKTFKFFKNH
jgi:hypothetical protein